MASNRIVRHLQTDRKPTDWSKFDALTDEDIATAVQDDPDAAPLVDKEWFEQARFVAPPNKVAINIRLDRDVLDFFKSEGHGYQSRINAVLRAFMEHNIAAKTRK